MPDILRVVEEVDTGTPTTVLDLNDGTIFGLARDTFKVAPAEPQQQFSSSGRRYGGARLARETHANGSLRAEWYIKDTTKDATIDRMEELLAAVEYSKRKRWIEWRPDGATNSIFYEIRGAGTWEPMYRWVEFGPASVMHLAAGWQIAPLGQGLPQTTMTVSGVTLPAKIELPDTIQGTAPALAQVSIETGATTEAPIWALIGWAARPSTPGSLGPAPFGIIEGESAATISGWAVTADATARGGSLLRGAAAALGTFSAEYTIDPSLLEPDDFTQDGLAVEVWARLNNTITSSGSTTRIVTSAIPAAGTNFGSPRYTEEFGANGRFLTSYSFTPYLMTRLGTLRLESAQNSPAGWRLRVAATFPTGVSGNFGLDYLMLVPARQRALGPTGKTSDSTYPKFIASTSATRKTIYHELNGTVNVPGSPEFPDHGLGGSVLELPPGQADLVVKLSNLVPDDPSNSITSSDLLSYTAAVSVKVTPRYRLAQ